MLTDTEDGIGFRAEFLVDWRRRQRRKQTPRAKKTPAPPAAAAMSAIGGFRSSFGGGSVLSVVSLLVGLSVSFAELSASVAATATILEGFLV